MKRRKKSEQKPWLIIGLILLVIATLAYIKIAFFPNIELATTEEKTVKEQPKEEIKAPKIFVNVFFLTQNDNKEEVYRAVKRPYNPDSDGSKLKCAIENLLKGPSIREKTKGVYSEIPIDTRLLAIQESQDKVIIDLSGDFGNGGGTDSLYKRLYQLIKTANQNANTSVYLYIDGKQADVVGGEGIMVNQPLNERSLDE